MPRKKLIIPSFKNEREEAAWWDKHRAMVEAELRVAIRKKQTASLKDIHDPSLQSRVSNAKTVTNRTA
jgi:hypothetical protein